MTKGEENVKEKQKSTSYKKLLKQIKENKPNAHNTIKPQVLTSGDLISKHNKI